MHPPPLAWIVWGRGGYYLTPLYHNNNSILLIRVAVYMYLIVVINNFSVSKYNNLTFFIFRLFQNIPTFYFPVLYFEQLVTVPSSMTFTLKILINFKVICWAIGFSCIVLGIFVLFCACYKLCTVNLFGKKKAKQKTFIKEAVPLTQWYSRLQIYRVLSRKLHKSKTVKLFCV